jgi:transcriptional regulator with XRE-family HTH domain
MSEAEKTIQQCVAETLRALREERCIGLRELARKAGVSTRTLQDLEQGTVDATLRTLARVAAGLDVSVRVLLTPKEHLAEPEWHRAIWDALGRLASDAHDMEQRITNLEQQGGPNA